MTISDYLFLIPLAILIGLVALGAYNVVSPECRYEDGDGAAERHPVRRGPAGLRKGEGGG